MIGPFFTRFLMSSLTTSSLIAIILIIKKTLHKHISVKWQYNMRFLILVILAVPFIPLSFDYIGALYGGVPGNYVINGNMDASLLSSGDGISEVFYGTGWLQNFSLSVNRTAMGYLNTPLTVIWLSGVSIHAIVTIVCNQGILRISKTTRPIANKEIAVIFEQCKAGLKITKNLILCESDLIQTPMVCGVLKTYIIMPSQIMGRLAPNDIKHIILHELCHYKKKDILVNYIMCLMQSLYWFNPVVYLAFKEMRADREIACDASVLEMLDGSGYIGYGMTIIGLAEKMSQPVFATAADMAGSKRQIKKRIEKIAAYKEDSMSLKIKSICVFLFACALVLVQIPTVSAMAYDNGRYDFEEGIKVQYEDLNAYFGEFEGSFVIYDSQSDKYSIYNKEKSVTRISPDSTYKIYSALIALETNVIRDEGSTLKWNGSVYPFDAWNRDQDLYSAMEDSVSWYFQDIDKLTGLKNLQAYFKDIGYGNYDLSGGISSYWQESSLLISPVEQVQLLKNFYAYELPFKRDHVETLKKAIKLSEKDGAVLSGKTGTGSVDGYGINGWFVGYVERDGRTYIFAANIQGREGANGSAAAKIALSILQDKNIY